MPLAQRPLQHSEEMKQNELNVLRGVENLDRIDEALYHDYETDIAKEVREWPGGSARSPLCAHISALAADSRSLTLTMSCMELI